MTPHPQILCFEQQWSVAAARTILAEILRVITEKGLCSLMLTGGNTVQGVYQAWRESGSFPYAGVSCYFGDERCVPPDHADSNYSMVRRYLFPPEAPGASIWRMEGEDVCVESAARRYEELLPDAVDVLLLSVGEDGHIASLFPGSSALHEQDRQVVPVVGPKPPNRRLTITPSVIARASSVFLLSTGAVKSAVLRNALQAQKGVETLPVRLALHGTWLIDTPL